MSEIKKIKSGLVEVTVTVDGDTWTSAVKKAYNNAKKGLSAPGFRKGHIPESMCSKMIDMFAIQMKAAEAVANDAFKSALREHSVDIIDEAEMKDCKPTEESCTFVFEVPVSPDVTLGDYSNLGYKVEEVTVSDDEVEAVVKELLEKKADMEVKDEDATVEMGDTAVIDFEGFKDGVAFDDGKAENYDLEVGSNVFIPGFEEQIVGMKAEESKEINVTFPEDYQVDDLKGQPAVFKVTVHEIKCKVTPELTDEFVAEQEIEDVKTVEELRNRYRENILAKKKMDAENKAVEEIVDKLSAASEVEIPEVMINAGIDSLYKSLCDNMMNYGMTIEMYLQYTGQTEEQVRENYREEANKRVKNQLVLKAVADAEKVEVTPEEIEEWYSDMSKMYDNMEIERIKKFVPTSQVVEDLKIQKVIEIIKK